ncbi:MAG: hypothetical protein M3Q97_01215 [Bacteroidota bacterium]|nr:hypothetical protein [Bacteroidota bacterium]
MIKANGNESLEMTFSPITINPGVQLNMLLRGKDSQGRIKCMMESLLYNSSALNRTVYAINSKLVANQVTLKGYINGQEVYSEVLQRPTSLDVNWWIVALAVVAISVYVGEKVDYNKVTYTITNTDGSVSTVTKETSSWQGIKQNDPPGTPVEWESASGVFFEADHLTVTSEETFPVENNPDRLTIPEAFILSVKGPSTITIDDELWG